MEKNDLELFMDAIYYRHGIMDEDFILCGSWIRKLELLLSGCDVNKSLDMYFVAAEAHRWIVWFQFEPLWRLLITYGLDVKENYLFDSITCEGNLEVIKLFIDRNCPVCYTDNLGNTLLHEAVSYCAKRNSTELIEILLSKGVNLNTENCDGDTPLHDALATLSKGPFVACFSILSLLLLEGAFVRSEDLTYFFHMVHLQSLRLKKCLLALVKFALLHRKLSTYEMRCIEERLSANDFNLVCNFNREGAELRQLNVWRVFNALKAEKLLGKEQSLLCDENLHTAFFQVFKLIHLNKFPLYQGFLFHHTVRHFRYELVQCPFFTFSVRGGHIQRFELNVDCIRKCFSFISDSDVLNTCLAFYNPPPRRSKRARLAPVRYA